MTWIFCPGALDVATHRCNMKFGRQFKSILQGYPHDWAQSAVPYRTLKKILVKFRQELLRRGFDTETLQTLLQNHSAEYSLKTNASRSLLRPHLTVRAITPGSPVDGSKLLEIRIQIAGLRLASADSCDDLEKDDNGDPLADWGESKWIEVPLTADVEFFSELQKDVNRLNTLEETEKGSMHSIIAQLGGQIGELSKPGRFTKSDLYRWREIFQLYLEANIYFSTTEADRGSHNRARATKQLAWFQDQVFKRGLVHKFKLPTSVSVYATFLELNGKLLQNLGFQELNQKAVTKIIKKFDKRTSLQVTSKFRTFLCSERFMVESVAKEVCAEISKDVLARVPQTFDHCCPICQELSWSPVRLRCRHVFCIACTIKMQNKERVKNCPICREPTVTEAHEGNIDDELIKYYETWFPKEVREKQVANEQERGIFLFGQDYKYHRMCAVM